MAVTAQEIANTKSFQDYSLKSAILNYQFGKSTNRTLEVRNMLSRRTFTGGLLATAIVPYTNALTLGAKNRGAEPPYFTLLLPSDYDAQDLALQSFAIDDKEGRLYAQYVTHERPSQTIVMEYKFTPNDQRLPATIRQPTSEIGHQGLSLENTSDGPHLWAAAPGRSWEAVRFKYNFDGSLETQRYRLFDDSYMRFSITVAISYDQKWLIATSRKTKNYGGSNTIRVFALQDVLKSDSRDLSSSFKHEWSIPTKRRFPVQGIASNQDIIVISYGTSKANESKPVFVYTLDGTVQGMIPDIDPGKNSLLPRQSYEPEGLCYSRISGNGTPILFVGITTGRKETGRQRAIYELK